MMKDIPAQTILVYYLKHTDPLEGDPNDYPPNQKIVAIWDVTGLDFVSHKDLAEHNTENADLARIFYISNN